MMPEQQQLIQKAERSLEAAKLLAQEDLVEFSVSRAYYSMFYVAQALLLSKGLAFSSHAGVINAFGQQFIKNGSIPKEFHRALIAAERIRLKGDYDIDSGLTASDAEEQLAWAARFLELAAIPECSSEEEPSEETY